jgi:asparagine synthetase B (glutamine-hydrolysing)
MTLAHGAERDDIALPEWYARFTPGRTRPSGAGEEGAECTHVGPLTIFRPLRGCEIAHDDHAGRQLVVLFDGYLFDRRALGEELGCDAGSSHAALAAHAYRRWGAGMFDRLDGCYLAAVWDESCARLTIGHDALGRHPAFYAHVGRELWFAPNVLSLASSGEVPQRVNRLSVALQLLLFWPEAGQTFFETIRRVRPGHYLVAGDGGLLHEHKYWEPMPADDEPWLTEQAVHDEFEPMLMSAVGRCMELAPQGIMLSGGVDSVAVASLAAHHARCRNGGPLVAVCGRTGGPLSYEEEMQSHVIDRLGMPNVISTTEEWREGHNGVGLSLELTPDLPCPDGTWWVGTYTRFYRRTAKQQLRVLLTGAGGDNWLGVADTHAADLLGRFDLRGWLDFVRSNTTTGGVPLPLALRRLAWTSGVRPHLDTLLTRWIPEAKQRYHRRKWAERLPSWLCPEARLREELVDHLLRRRSPGLTPAGERPRSYYRHYLRSLDNPYLHHEYENAYHIESWCGLRLLSPYHDRRLVSFLNRIAPHTLIHGRRYKGLLRPVVAKYLPGLGLEDQRKLYPAADQQRRLRALRGEMAAAWSEQRFSTLARLGLVDERAARRDVDVTGRAGFGSMARIFTVMSAERWVQQREAA